MHFREGYDQGVNEMSRGRSRKSPQPDERAWLRAESGKETTKETVRELTGEGDDEGHHSGGSHQTLTTGSLFPARSQEALKKREGTPKFTVYPEACHDSWTETYANPRTIQVAPPAKTDGKEAIRSTEGKDRRIERQILWLASMRSGPSFGNS